MCRVGGCRLKSVEAASNGCGRLHGSKWERERESDDDSNSKTQEQMAMAMATAIATAPAICRCRARSVLGPPGFLRLFPPNVGR